MSRATEVYSREFDVALLKLPARIRSQVEAKIEDLGSRLASYRTIAYKGDLNFAYGLVTTGSSMTPISSRNFYPY